MRNLNLCERVSGTAVKGGEQARGRAVFFPALTLEMLGMLGTGVGAQCHLL